jgi:hypothetical protein
MENGKMTKKPEENALPYQTTDDNILKLIDAIKRKEGNEGAIKKIYSGKKFETTRKSLGILGILEDGVTLTPNGREYVFEQDENKKVLALLREILEYSPYEHLLLNISQQGFPEETDLEVVKSYWGKHSYGSSANNREEAASVFGYFVKLAGLGDLVLGRRGKSSRIIWNPLAGELMEKAQDKTTLVETKNDDDYVEEAVDQLNHDTVLEDLVLTPDEEELNNKTILVAAEPASKQSTKQIFEVTPTVNVSVDMSDWEIEKITAFFKAAYGAFSHDKD